MIALAVALALLFAGGGTDIQATITCDADLCLVIVRNNGPLDVENVDGRIYYLGLFGDIIGVTQGTIHQDSNAPTFSWDTGPMPSGSGLSRLVSKTEGCEPTLAALVNTWKLPLPAASSPGTE